MTGTEMLGQQELLEPEPRRRLQVAPGRNAWWGVDPSTRGVSVAGVSVSDFGDGLDRWARTVPFSMLTGPERLSEIYRETHALFASLGEHAKEDGVPAMPGIVLIEQPSGTYNTPELVYAVGVVVAAIYDGLYDSIGPTHVEMVTSGWWKKRACGRGNISKPKKRGEDYEVLTWAQRNGYTRLSWDEADAWGMAEAARREIALVPR